MDRPRVQFVVGPAALAIVGWVFRLRENNPFNTHPRVSWLPMDPADLMPRNGDTMQLVARMAELECKSSPPARIYETVIQSHGAGVDDVVLAVR